MDTERDDGVSRTVLPSGLRVVTERLPAVRSVALGIWVGVGSRDEDHAHAAGGDDVIDAEFKEAK